jgi:hypothetical protein
MDTNSQDYTNGNGKHHTTPKGVIPPISTHQTETQAQELSGRNPGPNHRVVLEINLPEPIVLRSDTQEQIDAILRLIKTAKTPNYFQCVVTPQLAAEFLKLQSEHQRGRREKVLLQLISDFGRGQFIFTGDPIRFQVGGIGKDGQHRLTAQVIANVTATYLVMVGMSAEALAKIDNGITRTVRDIIRLRGENRIAPSNIMSTAINLEAANFDKKVIMSVTDKVAAADALSDEEMLFLSEMSTALQEGKIRSAGTLGGALRALRMYPDSTTVEFLGATFGNKGGHPAFIPNLSAVLYNYLNTSRSAKGDRPEAIYNQVVAVIRTVRAFVEGGEVKHRPATPREISRLSVR